jgi:uncharacterized protein YbjT (DUF2867 family)
MATPDIDAVGRTAAALLQEHWEGRRVVELEGAQRVSPNALADAFAKVLAQPVRAEAVPRDRWESIFRAQCTRIRAISGVAEELRMRLLEIFQTFVSDGDTCLPHR